MADAPRFTAPTAKILVVDDLPTNIRLFKELITPCGAKIFIALSGAKAIEMIQKEQYDLVFMDQMMPEMDGMETIAKIRALDGESFRAIPIVLLTANETPPPDSEITRLGINGFLTKPVDVAKLFDTIQELLPPDKKQPQ